MNRLLLIFLGCLLNISLSKGYIDVRKYGAKGNGISDDTQAINRALKENKLIYIPKGIWLVDNIFVPAGRSIKTDGTLTIVQQKSQGKSDSRVINIIGSDVSIGDIKIRGNISKDINEQNHGIFVSATDGKIIKKLKLGKIVGENIRGDVVYLSSRTGSSLFDVYIEAVYGKNIFRNVISITGGKNIVIKSIQGEEIGFLTLDIEPEHYNTEVSNIRIGTLKGGFVGINASSPKHLVSDVVIDNLFLDYSSRASSPLFLPIQKREKLYGITFRNCKGVQLTKVNMRGFPCLFIGDIKNKGEYGTEDIEICELYIYDTNNSDCHKTLISLGGTKNFVFGNIQVNSISEKSVFLNSSNLVIDNIIYSGKLRSELSKYGENVVIKKQARY